MYNLHKAGARSSFFLCKYMIRESERWDSQTKTWLLFSSTLILVSFSYISEIFFVEFKSGGGLVVKIQS